MVSAWSQTNLLPSTTVILSILAKLHAHLRSYKPDCLKPIKKIGEQTMETRFYQAEGIDVERLATDLEHMFLSHGYQVQHFGSKEQMTVQMKKGGDFAAIVGMQSALTVTMQRSSSGVLAMIGQQKWVDKAVVGAVGFFAAPVLWPLMITAGVGAIQQASLGNQVSHALDVLARQQDPHVHVGPIPPEMMPQYEPPRAYQPPPCRHCAFCGSPSTPPNPSVI